MPDFKEITWERVDSSAKRKAGFSREPEKSFMKTRNKTGPKTLPWGNPALAWRGEERIKSTTPNTGGKEVSGP